MRLARTRVRAPRGGKGAVNLAAVRRSVPLLVGIAILVLWETTTRLGLVAPLFLPAPTAVVGRLVEDLAGTRILGFAATTLGEALAGAAIATALAVPMGYLVAKSTIARRIIEPYAAASQAIPAIALAPLLVLWIGYGFVPIVVLCAIMVFFPIMLNTTLGLTHIPRDIVDAARLDGAGRGNLLLHIELPLAMPSILTGLRNGFTLSITGAVVGEFTMGGRGLGLILTMQRDSVDTTGMFSTLVVLCAAAISLYFLIGSLEKKVENRL